MVLACYLDTLLLPRRWGVCSLALEYAEEFFAERITLFALFKKPVQVADFDMSSEPVYLSPNNWFEFCSHSFEIYLIDKTLNNLLAFTRDPERFLVL